MQTIFSGDDRTAPVTETIQIVDTRVPLSLLVRSYGKIIILNETWIGKPNVFNVCLIARNAIAR